jgi:leader peptidase (prepilin peptidase)/N-methyltransferase
MVELLILILGLVFGSFVNALVWRLKKKKNWVSERSICTHCGHTLSPLDLVPILSYLFLRGRCRYCHKKIEDSPYIELGLGLTFLISYIFWPYSFDALGVFRFVVWLTALVSLAAMFVYDLRWTILPDKLTRYLLFLATVQLVVLLAAGDLSISDAPAILASVFIGGGVFHLIYEFSKGRYIGGGDVKLGYAYGLLLLDPLMSWVVLALASLIGSIIAVVLIISKKKSLGSKLPFGPMLITGLFITVLFGQKIWSALNALMLY